MGLDVSIIMCKNRKQVENPAFWEEYHTGWVKDADGVVDYTKPCEVYYARKFWDLYTPAARHFGIDNCEYSDPLTKEDIEYLIDLATHNRDYFGGFETVPELCEILDRYDEATNAGMIFLFEGDF